MAATTWLDRDPAAVTDTVAAARTLIDAAIPA